MTVRRKELGRFGEETAVEYLSSIGYTVLCRNYRCRNAEIDIIAQDGDTTVFVEVKTFAYENLLENPVVNVTRAKQKRIILAAKHYLATLHGEDIKCRFDVIGIMPERAERVEHLQGAFVD
jgi:putative endonuclease